MESWRISHGRLRARLVARGYLTGKVKREETDLQKDKNGSITYKDMQETEAPWPAKKVDVAIPLGLSYEYMNVILDARYNVSLTKAGKGDWDNCKNKALTFTVGYRFTL
jgi:hypothetical protein